MARRTDDEQRTLRPARVAALALCAALVAWWAWQQWRAPEAGPDASDRPSAAAPSAAPASGTSPAASAGRTAAGAASRTAGPAAGAADALPVSPDGLTAAQLAQIEKQWCTHGLQAHQQAQQALERVYPPSKDGVTLDYQAFQARVDASLKEASTQAMLAVQHRLKRLWIEQLRQRGDMRSQAAADYLLSTMSFGEDARAAFQHLLSLAQSSRDPMIFMVWQLAKSHCVQQPQCSALPMSDWRMLDARNLLAWLPAGPGGQSAADLDWQALAATTFASSYLEDLQALLLPMLEHEPPGLALQQGLALISQLRNEWPGTMGAIALSSGCLAPGETSPARLPICLHVADLLWRSPSAGLFEYKFATSVALLAGATEQPPWAGRLALVAGLSAADSARLMELDYLGARSSQGCDTQAALRRQLQERVRQGLWAAALGSERARRIP